LSSAVSGLREGFTAVIGRLSFILVSTAGAITTAVSTATGLVAALLAVVVFLVVVLFLAVLFLA
jgi:hypothetical protein